MSPAIAAGVSDRLCGIGDIVAPIEKAESRLPAQGGPYKKRTAQAVKTAWLGSIDRKAGTATGTG